MADAPESTAKIESLRAKVEADPKSRHFYPLAEELRKVGQLEDAEKVLRAGLVHHGSYLSAWIGLGRVLKDRAAYPEAVDVLMKGLSLDPENVVAAKLLAHVYLAMGEKVEAIKKFKLVQALMPADEETEEQIAALENELHAQAAPPPPVTAEPMPVDDAGLESPHDSTEPPFPMDEPPAPLALERPAVSEEVPETGGGRFDLTNPDPFALDEGEPAPAPEPELADDVQPFADAELPEDPSVEQAGVTEEDPFAAITAPDEPVRPARAPSSEDVWAAEEEEPAGSLPESAATVTMAQILVQQGDLDRARETYERVLQRDPGNVEAREGLAALEPTDLPKARTRGGKVERLDAWRRKVAGS